MDKEEKKIKRRILAITLSVLIVFGIAGIVGWRIINQAQEEGQKSFYEGELEKCKQEAEELQKAEPGQEESGNNRTFGNTKFNAPGPNEEPTQKGKDKG